MTLLTQVQNAGVKKRLDALDLRLRNDIRATLLQSGDQTYIDLAGLVHDPGDEAAANQLIGIDDALIERHRGNCVRSKRRAGVSRMAVSTAASNAVMTSATSACASIQSRCAASYARLSTKRPTRNRQCRGGRRLRLMRGR